MVNQNQGHFVGTAKFGSPPSTFCPVCEKRASHLASRLSLCGTCVKVTYEDAVAMIELGEEAARQSIKEARAEHASSVTPGRARGGVPGYVYFIKRGSLVKIGWSRNPEKRCAQLGGGGALLATMPGYMADEKAMHRRFDQLRVEGEWFAYTPALARYITDLAAEAA